MQSVIYEGLGDWSDWTENLHASYVNLVRVVGAYSLEAGVRVEQTEVTFTIPEENVHYDGSDAYEYVECFPTSSSPTGWVAPIG